MRFQTRFLLVMALVAAVYTLLPHAGDPQPRAAFAAPAGGDAVTIWNANAGVAATKACIAPLDDPFHEARMYAMMHIAIHDALNAIDRKFQPYAFDKKAAPGTSPDAAVAAAARDVLDKAIGALPLELVKKECIDAGTTSVEAAYRAAIDAIPDSPAKTQGIALGQAAAAAILAKRADDHATGGPFLNKNCPKPEPGKYQCTPGFPFIAFEAWERVTPFVLQDNAQFRPGPPSLSFNLNLRISDKPIMGWTGVLNFMRLPTLINSCCILISSFCLSCVRFNSSFNVQFVPKQFKY